LEIKLLITTSVKIVHLLFSRSTGSAQAGGEDAQFDHDLSGEDMEEDERQATHGMPPPHDSSLPGEGSSFMSQDQWGWIQTEMGTLPIEQTRQGAELDRQSVELFRKGTVMDDMQAMMQRLMLHFRTILRLLHNSDHCKSPLCLNLNIEVNV
jgi:hypothetical protein